MVKYAAVNNDQAFIFLSHCCWKCKVVSLFWRTVWILLTKLNIILSYKPATALFGFYPNELKKSHVQKKLHTDISISLTHNCENLVVLQIRCPSAGKWIKYLVE